jgi:hypothetical protein
MGGSQCRVFTRYLVRVRQVPEGRLVREQLGPVELVAVEEAQEVVEATGRRVAQVPFPEHVRGVARTLQHLGERRLVQRQAFLLGRRQLVLRDADGQRVSPGQQRHPRRCARFLRVVLGQCDAGRLQAFQVRRHFLLHGVVPLVVGQVKDDVGRPRAPVDQARGAGASDGEVRDRDQEAPQREGQTDFRRGRQLHRGKVVGGRRCPTAESVIVVVGPGP